MAMTLQRKSRVKRENPKARMKQDLLSGFSGMELLGQVITWDAHGPHQLKAVIQALKDAGLDEKYAKEFKFGNAFNRACNQLSEERVIDVLRQDADEVLFQFSKKHTIEDTSDGTTEFEYKKEVKIRLNKDTGKLTCKNEEVRKQAEAELDRCMNERTTSDITSIVQQLFEKHADLIPLRDRGGVYFVPQRFEEYILKAHDFLIKLGGKINRLPVPAGTQYGDTAIADAVGDAINKLVEGHLKAVEGFTLNTRADTIETQAERIKATRVKVQAYAEYLKDRSGDLLKAVDDANDKLHKQIEKLTEEKKNLPPDAQGISQAGAICVAVTGKLVTLEQIVGMTGLKAARIKSHLKYLQEKGRLRVVGNTYMMIA